MSNFSKFQAIQSLFLDAQNENSLQQIHYLENKPHHRQVSPDRKFPKPQFLKPIPNYDQLIEGQNLQLDTILEPTGDPSLRVQWFLNGHPISEGEFTS